MKMSIDEHKKALADQLVYIHSEEAKAGELFRKVAWLRKQYSEYERQVEVAQKEGLTEFDKYKYFGV